jgi:hypothetical protein
MRTDILKQFGSGMVGITVLAFTLAVQAQPSINGAIYFNGGAMLNAPLSGATTYTNFFGSGGIGTLPYVLPGSQTGNYGAVADNTPATFFTPFQFNSFVSPFTLWSFTAGGTNYSFEVTSVNIVTQNSGYLNLTGTGIAHIDNFSNTAGTWSITGLPGPGTMVTLNAAFSVPEPSALSLMLSFGPIVWFTFVSSRRKSRSAS